MATVTLNERVDLEAVKYLMSMPKAWWEQVLKTDKDRTFKGEYKKVKDFLNLINDIFTHNVAATQELDTIVTNLLAEIASLKERLSVLEN